MGMSASADLLVRLDRKITLPSYSCTTQALQQQAAGRGFDSDGGSSEGGGAGAATRGSGRVWCAAPVREFIFKIHTDSWFKLQVLFMLSFSLRTAA
jgi:hypothetical protein